MDSLTSSLSSYSDSVTSQVKGLSLQGKTALLIGGGMFIGSEIASQKVFKSPLHSLLQAALVGLTVYNVECLARPRACGNWAWVNVGFLALNMLGLYSGRMFMQELEDAEEKLEKRS